MNGLKVELQITAPPSLGYDIIFQDVVLVITDHIGGGDLVNGLKKLIHKLTHN